MNPLLYQLSYVGVRIRTITAVPAGFGVQKLINLRP